jgi:hypothetical protein
MERLCNALLTTSCLSCEFSSYSNAARCWTSCSLQDTYYSVPFGLSPELNPHQNTEVTGPQLSQASLSQVPRDLFSVYYEYCDWAYSRL